MRILILFLACSFFITSCKKGNDIIRNTLASENGETISENTKINTNIQMNSFEELGDTDILLFPISISDKSRIKSSSYKGSSYHGYWNIIFYNIRTSEYHLLTDKKVLIQNYNYNFDSSKNGNKTAEDYIFYTVISEDFNNDKALNTDDPRYLFVSDKTGKSFRQISPSGYDVNNWTYYHTSNKVIMLAQKDSNNNKKFDQNDETVVFEYEMGISDSPREIFSSNFMGQIKSLYETHWMNK